MIRMTLVEITTTDPIKARTAAVMVSYTLILNTLAGADSGHSFKTTALQLYWQSMPEQIKYCFYKSKIAEVY